MIPHRLMASGSVTPLGGVPRSGDGTGDGAGDAMPLDGRVVLVVEDEALIAMQLEFALLDAGATVIGPVAHLDEAHEALAEREVDLALLDVDLAGVDVFPVADRLRERAVPFAFHTGHAERRVLAQRYGDAPVCRKPTDVDEVVGVLASL